MSAAMLFLGLGTFVAALAALLAHRHERAHCHQLGELQHLLADLTEHIGDRTADPLPEELAEYLACIRTQQAHDDERGDV